ncbi:MAG: 2'-5' RNA ligase family protein [Sphingomonadales bacterium]|nr:MAG: 2'-5' RNA ligase family protein [Sphingomonadales bacterium]
MMQSGRIAPPDELIKVRIYYRPKRSKRQSASPPHHANLPSMRARNPLYVMAKPPPEVQAQIAALPRNDPGRGPDLLHVTLISLYDFHYAPPEWLPATIAALDGFAAAPFPLAFDRIENRKAVTLRTREPLAEARAFQKALVNHLLREKAPIMDGTTPEPHITINYRGDRLGTQTLGKKMPPIGWTVDEIILMESVVGKTTHVEHGRWPLCGGAG